jgi:hypothetical protein
MAVAPPPPNQQEVQLVSAAQQQVAATLAAAVIAGANRPHSVREAVDIYHDVYWSLFPRPNTGHYQAWQKLNKAAEVHT